MSEAARDTSRRKLSILLMNEEKRKCWKMTESEYNSEIEEIVKKHLKAMANEVQSKLMIVIDDYDEIFCDSFFEKLMSCFRPFIGLKTKS